MTENIDPKLEARSMATLFTGYVGMTVFQSNPARVFKVTDMAFSPPDAFLVRFASGLVLRVKVEPVEEIETKET